MKEQFYLSIQDLWTRKKNSLSLLLQMTMALLLLQFIFNSFFTLQNMIQEVQHLTQIQDIYFLLDITPDERFSQILNAEISEGREKNQENLILLFEFIFKNEAFQSLPLQSFTFLPPDERFEKFLNDTESTISFMYATSLLEHLFDLNITSGRFFDEADYIDNHDRIPVVLGYDFMDVFEIGNTFEDSFKGEMETFEVVGFLEENSTYIDIMSSWNFQSFDQVILRPLNPNHFSNPHNLMLPLSKIYIVPESTDQMHEIVASIDDLDLFSFIFRNMNDQLQFLTTERMMNIQSQLFLTGLVTILTLINFTISLLQFIDKKRYEFGVHYLVGATNKTIGFRIAFQIIPFLIIGNIIRISLLNQLDYGWLTMGVSLLFCILICLLPLIKMSSLNLSSIIRWRIT